MRILKLFILLCNFSLFSLTAQEATNVIDTKSSTLNWVGKKITTSQHNGSLKFLSGELTICPNNDGSESLVCGGKFSVDMTSLLVEDLTGSGKKRLEGHLKSDDFFSVNKHKTAYLSINSSKATDSGFIAQGSLTIKDITHPIEFKLTRNLGGFVADLVFDRSKYNVKYNSGSFFENLGDNLILDDIELTANLYFQ